MTRTIREPVTALTTAMTPIVVLPYLCCDEARVRQSAGIIDLEQVTAMSLDAGRLEIIRKGPRSRPEYPPLLLVHGAWHGAWCWQQGFMDALADRGYEVAALSLRGHGNSPGSGRFAMSRHGIRDYVEDVAAVADMLTRLPVIVGHFIGGFVAQRYLCDRHPATGAVLLAPVPPTGVLPLFLRLLRSEPLATATAVVSLNLGRLLHDSVRASRLLFSDALEATELLALHPLLSGESFRVFVELLAPRLDIHRAVAPVAVIAPALTRSSRLRKLVRLQMHGKPARRSLTG
jgi:hypothetical protein